MVIRVDNIVASKSHLSLENLSSLQHPERTFETRAMLLFDVKRAVLVCMPRQEIESGKEGTEDAYGLLNETPWKSSSDPLRCPREGKRGLSNSYVFSMSGDLAQRAGRITAYVESHSEYSGHSGYPSSQVRETRILEGRLKFPETSLSLCVCVCVCVCMYERTT